ncbi:nucleotidyltransferase domain-containing protein [Bacillota bacterium]
MYGFLMRDLNNITRALKKYEEVEEAILFGSRAMGNYKAGSDVDLALIGDKVDRKVVRRLSDDLNEEYPLPYFFDVISYNEISNEGLKEHIDNVGEVVYRRG